MKLIYCLILLFLVSCSGTPPELGFIDGKLRNCPENPNCVTSYENAPDKEHFIDPFKIVGNKENSYAKILKILENEGNCKIVKKESNYIRSEFTSSLMRFVDDVEFLFLSDGSDIIHVRSSSRIGRKDFGVNRKRVEMIRFKYHQNDF